MYNRIQQNLNVNPTFGAKNVDKKDNTAKTMEEHIAEMLKNLSDQENYIAEYGDFAPVMEFFENPDPKTQEFVGKYGMKIYKMPKDVVPDPKKRYVEAAAYIPSGKYKADMTVGSGTKEEVLKLIRDPEFAKTLPKIYQELTEQFEHYD